MKSKRKETGDFFRAVRWLELGKKVRGINWNEGTYIICSKGTGQGMFAIYYQQGTRWFHGPHDYTFTGADLLNTWVTV